MKPTPVKLKKKKQTITVMKQKINQEIKIVNSNSLQKVKLPRSISGDKIHSNMFAIIKKCFHGQSIRVTNNVHRRRFKMAGSKYLLPSTFYMVEEASLSPCFMLSSGQFLFIFCLFFFPYLCLIIYVSFYMSFQMNITVVV